MKSFIKRKNRKANRPTEISLIASAPQLIASTGANRSEQIIHRVFECASQCWHWIRERQKRAAHRSLRVEETVALGQKRFVAIVKVDNQRFLLGVGSEVSLLATFQTEPSFSEVLRQSTGGTIEGRAEECA